mgnify:CR=1 FL=1
MTLGTQPHNRNPSRDHLCGGARLAGREACPRARARDERVAEGDERIGWGGCGELVSGCHAVMFVIDLSSYTYRIG